MPTTASSQRRDIVLIFDDGVDERETAGMMVEADAPLLRREIAESAAAALRLLERFGNKVKVLWADVDAPEIGSGNEVIRQALEVYGVPHVLVTSGGANLDPTLRRREQVKALTKGGPDRDITDFLTQVGDATIAG